MNKFDEFLIKNIYGGRISEIIESQDDSGYSMEPTFENVE